MANLFFPQLTSGALAQFPIKKIRSTRTLQNILPDGTLFQLPDPGADRLLWQLSYQQLSPADLAALQAHFAACLGPLRGFTFIDPTDNMLASSSDLTRSVWQKSSLVNLQSGVADPTGGTGAFSMLNIGQISQGISQALAVPAGYQYCFSAYASSATPTTISLMWQGPSTQATNSFIVGPSWTRILSAGRLQDSGSSLTVSVSLGAGQEINIFGLQLEAQLKPSEYRPTGGTSGVYPNAHWASQELTVTAEAPDLYATSFGILTSL